MATSVLAANDVHIPPLLLDLQDLTITLPDGRQPTAKEWYYFWRQSGDRINILNRMVSYGNHADRADPSLSPDGALYVEGDRSDVLYQKHQDSQGNAWWQYVAGTMWGTISPDQRPTDLGVHDAGFQFRSIDTNPLLGGHEWIWSGTVWIETTPNRYGTHASRLAQSLGNTWNGMIWVETDRGEATYQNQSGAWVYVSGVMTSALASKPTDLGVNDAGFKFCATDYNHVLMWNGSGWQWGPGETGSGYFSSFAVPPAGNGWHLCDGSGVTYLNPDSTTASITLPNAAGSPCYVKGGNSFSATVNPANNVTGSHTLTVAEMPVHDHGLSQIDYAVNFTTTGGSVALTGAGTPITQRTDGAGSSAGHTHPLTGDMVANFGAYLYFRQ